MDDNPAKALMCQFGTESLRCSRCGYLAKRLPTYRVCKTIPEMAQRIAVTQTTKRIAVAPLQIGTGVSRALSAVGITPERIKRITGKDCGCDKRKMTLDAVGAAASSIIERGLNGLANFVVPVTVEPEDIAAISNALQASTSTNAGLKDGPPALLKSS